MDDYISREAAISKILSDPTDAHYPSWYAEKLKQIPAADVRPAVHGKWKKRMEEKETPYYKSFTPIWSCSECGTEYDPSLCMTINFCPNCGADCRGGNDGK
jgi:hypothetical protein